MDYNVISTGSKGNCVVLNKNIMMDIGVSYRKISAFAKDIKLVFIQHTHGDHINLKTLKTLQSEHPSIRIACGKFVADMLDGINNIDIVDIDKWYNYGVFMLSPIKGYHDVPTFGARIYIGNTRIIYITDTAHLDGITAKDYDYFFLEHNYDEERAEEAIRIAEQTGEYCHAKGSVNSHLSYKQAWSFYQENKKETSEVIKLHMSSKYS